jgi:hypothetical protein
MEIRPVVAVVFQAVGRKGGLTDRQADSSFL